MYFIGFKFTIFRGPDEFRLASLVQCRFAETQRHTVAGIHEDVMALLCADSNALRLSILRGETQLLIDVPTGAWEEQAVFSTVSERPIQHLGYIAARIFTLDSGTQVRKAGESLASRAVNRCILDLRNNPGGYLDAMAVSGSAACSWRSVCL
jgi:carboxyl-terminal processing protease